LFFDTFLLKGATSSFLICHTSPKMLHFAKCRKVSQLLPVTTRTTLTVSLLAQYVATYYVVLSALKEPVAKENYMRRMMRQLPEANHTTAVFILDHLIKYVTGFFTTGHVGIRLLLSSSCLKNKKLPKNQNWRLGVTSVLSFGLDDIIQMVKVLSSSLNIFCQRFVICCLGAAVKITLSTDCMFNIIVYRV